MTTDGKKNVRRHSKKKGVDVRRHSKKKGVDVRTSTAARVRRGGGTEGGAWAKIILPFLSFEAKGYRTIWTVDVFRGFVPKKK